MADPQDVRLAERPSEVLEVLAAVERAVAAGRWAAGFLAYEAAAAFDPAVALPAGEGTAGATVAGSGTGPPAPPLACFGIFGGRLPVAPIGAGPVPLRAGDGAVPSGAAAGAAPPPSTGAPGRASVADGWEWTVDRPAHQRSLVEVRRRIEAGDVYQVNLTCRLRRPWPAGDAGRAAVARAYGELVAAQQGAHHALVEVPGTTVCCASPEAFVVVDGDRAECRPMKGTAPRGRPPGGAADDARGRALAASAKERAENVMIVDLMRNDLGRVAVPGSVAVPDLCRVEAYPTVWQMTSTVTARLRRGTGLVDLLAALFPCGSVTGAPKLAAMAAIADLEPWARGVYCGAVGWVGPGRHGPVGRFAVAIRTVVVDHRRGVAEYGVGGAVTWPSTAPAEWRELQAKAAVLDRVRWPAPAPAPAAAGLASAPGR